VNKAADKSLKDRIESDRKKGNEMRSLRTSKGIQLKFVAEKLGITSGYLSDLERGNRHWSDLLEASFRKAIGA